MTYVSLKETNKGFTLVETLVAISILLIATVGPLTAASKGLQNSYAARDRIVAVYLAQESLEQVIKLRQENALQENGGGASSASDTWAWYDDLPTDCKNGNGCDYEVASDSFEACSAINNCTLYFSNTSGAYYQYNPNAESIVSPFTRTVEVVELVEDQEAEIIVTVSWDSTALGVDQVELRSSVLNEYDGI